MIVYPTDLYTIMIIYLIFTIDSAPAIIYKYVIVAPLMEPQSRNKITALTEKKVKYIMYYQ